MPVLRSLLAFGLFSLGASLFAQLSGTYTIGGADGYFTSLTEAVQALKTSGVSAAVTFRLRPGTYAATIIPSISGASAQNSITFEADAPDSLSVTLRGVCELQGAYWVRFRRLRLTNHPSQSKAVVRLWNTHEVRFENCHIEESTPAAYAYDEGLVKLYTLQAPDSVRNYFSNCYLHSNTRVLAARNLRGRFLFEYCRLTGNWDLWLGEYRGAFWYNNIVFYDQGAHNAAEFYYNTIASAASQPYLDLICGKFVGNTIPQTLRLNASLIKNNTFWAETSIRRAGETAATIAQNRFYAPTDFSRCLNAQIRGNEFRGPTYLTGCDGAQVYNNLFYSDTEVAFGTNYRLIQNNFAPEKSLLFWFIGGLVVNNNIGNLRVEESAITLRDNNYFPSGAPTYASYQDSNPRFYNPAYVSLTDNLRSTNPLLIGKAGATFFPGLAQDVDGQARTYPATIGANELCYAADFPDTVWVSCTESSLLRWCSPAQASAYFWTDLEQKDTLPAQTALWPHQGAQTLLLHSPTGVADTVVFALTPFDALALSRRKYYAWCGSQLLLNTYAPPTAQVSWSPIEGLDDPHAPKTIAHLSDTITYVAAIQVGHCALLHDTIALYVDQRPRAYFKILDQTDGWVSFANYATCAQTYYWDFGDGSTSDLFSPQHQYISEGYYLVSLTVQNAYGTAAYSQGLYVLLPNVATHTLAEEPLRLYPNPSTGRFWVTLDASLKDKVGELCLRNSLGQIVWRQPNRGLEVFEVDATALPAGRYLLTLDGAYRLLSQHLLLTH